MTATVSNAHGCSVVKSDVAISNLSHPHLIYLPTPPLTLSSYPQASYEGMSEEAPLCLIYMSMTMVQRQT